MKFVTRVLRHGAVYICAWGRDCARVELCFDYEIVGPRMKKEDLPLIPTASDPWESLDDPLSYFLECAKPVNAYARTCKSWLAVSVGSAASSRRIEKFLRMPMLDEEFGI